jgi:hypothetical protein
MKKLNHWNQFPKFFSTLDEKYVKPTLSRIHDNFLWKNRHHIISK